MNRLESTRSDAAVSGRAPLLELLVAATLLAVPFYLPWHVGPAIVTPSDLLMLAAVAVWLRSEVRPAPSGERRPEGWVPRGRRWSPFTWAALAFLLASVLSWAGAVDRAAAVKETMKYALILGFVGASARALRAGPVLPLVLVAGETATLFASVQGLAETGVLGWISGGLRRAPGFFGQPNSLGALIALGVALTATLLAETGRGEAPPEAKRRRYVLYSLVLGVQLLGLASTLSRGAVWGALVGTAVGLLAAGGARRAPGRGDRRRIWAAVALTGLVLGVAGWVTASRLALEPAAGVLGAATGDRGTGSATGPARVLSGLVAAVTRDRNTVARIELWRAAILLMLHHPLTGVGGGNFGLRYEAYVPPELARLRLEIAHNTYLNVAAEDGFPGFIAFLATIVFYYRGSLAALRRGAAGGGPAASAAARAASFSLAACSAAFAIGLVDHILQPGVQEWLALFLGAGLAAGRAPQASARHDERGAAPGERIRLLLVWHAATSGAYAGRYAALARAGVDVTVLFPKLWRENGRTYRAEAAVGAIRAAGAVPVPAQVLFPFHGSLYLYAGGLTRALLTGPEVIHIHEEPWSLATLQLRWAAHFLAPEARIVVESWQNILRRYPAPFRWIEQDTLRQVDALVAGSREIADVLSVKGAPRERIHVVPLGTDTDLFRPVESAGGDAAEASAEASGAGAWTDTRPFRVGYAGRIVEAKGLATLFQALAELDFPWELRLAGEGPDRARLAEAALRLGIAERLRWLGAVRYEQLPGFYRSIDVLVLPSESQTNWKEQFGRVLVEAMACACPVIGSSSGEIPRVVGGAGLLFPERDAARLTRQLRKLAQDTELRRELALAGRRRVIQEYSWQAVAGRMRSLYEALRGAPPNRPGEGAAEATKAAEQGGQPCA